MNQQCKVCGEPAAGFHFGAFTCEGCKSFFGRTYNNLNSISECKNNGECVIDKKNRTACKACRLRKCLLVGMSKSGSRYGRRSNWFKIHCLLQEQQQIQQHQHPGLIPSGFLRSHPYLPLFQHQLIDTKSSESDSGASSIEPEDDLRASRLIKSPFSEKDYFSSSSQKKLSSPFSDSECLARKKLTTANLTLSVSPASLPSISPGGTLGVSPRCIPVLAGRADLTSWKDHWLSGPPIADVSQEEPIDLSIRSNSNITPPISGQNSDSSDTELSIDVGIDNTIKTIPLDLSVETNKRIPDLRLNG